jgi:hypothetical protein
MNTNQLSLEMTEITSSFPKAQATNLTAHAETNPEIQLPSAAAGPTAILAKCLLLPAAICASVLLIKVALVATDIIRILNEVYASGQFS